MPDRVKTRPYRSSRRAQAAAATRDAIIKAASQLFAEHGYAATAVAAIAERAGVSIDTVYASVGRKPQLVLAAVDGALSEGAGPVPAEERGYVKEVRAAKSAREKIATYATALGRVMPVVAPLLVALGRAGDSDPECAAMSTMVSERRAANMRLFAADLRASGGVRDDLTDDQIGDVVWSMNAPEYFVALQQRGWTIAQYVDWLTDAWTKTLLKPSRPRAR